MSTLRRAETENSGLLAVDEWARPDSIVNSGVPDSTFLGSSEYLRDYADRFLRLNESIASS